MLKAIDTVYNGYRFRSRLEARYAVFLDVLGVKYQYEPEGYDLDGVYYLPDFYLPDLDCWIEIKGQKPTKEECEKAKRLAWHTRKMVYIFFGDVWCPWESLMEADDLKKYAKVSHSAYGFGYYHVWKEDEREPFFRFPYWEGPDGDTDKAEEHLRNAGGNVTHVSVVIAMALEEAHMRLGDMSSSIWWAECPKCHKLGLSPLGESTRLPCGCINDKSPYAHKYGYKSPRLKSAYSAARQARFEHERRQLGHSTGLL